MELPVKDREFVTVDYPAIIQNEEKMLNTIGGEQGVKKVKTVYKLVGGYINSRRYCR